MTDPTPPTAEPSPDLACHGWDPREPELSDVARRRRDEIMDAAEAVIAGQGIDELSLAKIEQRAGMSRGQLTYYFPRREQILLAVYERMIRRMVRDLLAGDGPKPMTGRAWDCFRHAVRTDLEPGGPGKGKELFSLLYTFLAQMGHRPDYREKLAEMYRGWRGHIAADVAGSVPEPRPVHPTVLASLIQALLQGLEIQLTIDPEAFDRGAMLDACLRLFAPAFHPDAAPPRECPDGDPDRTP